MNNFELKMRDDVMSRIKTVNFIRNTINSPLYEGIFILGVFTLVVFSISLRHIFMNTMAHERWIEYFPYLFSSFLHTRTFIQISFVLIMIASMMFCLNIIKKFKNSQVSI